MKTRMQNTKIENLSAETLAKKVFHRELDGKNTRKKARKRVFKNKHQN